MTVLQTVTEAGGPKVVGLTGGIGSGKSSAREFFATLGVPCIDADLVAREIRQDPGHLATQELAAAFPDMLADNGTLKRGSLQSLFAIDPAANRRLKAILKPHVMEAIKNWTESQSARYVIWESALLLEEDIAADRVLVVDADEDERVARIRQRNPDWTVAQIRKVLAMQLPRQTYLQRAHDIICNDGPAQELQQQVQAMHRRYMTSWG